MIISITGNLGSGKSSSGKLLAEKLHYKFYSTGRYMREMAKEHDMTCEEFGKYAENNKEVDLELDRWQTEIGKKENNFIIDARLGWHFIPKSVKVFLKCNDDVAARRIFNDKSSHRKKEKEVESVEEKKEQIRIRRESEKIRYKKYYDVDMYDMDNYDLIIDTSEQTPEETAENIFQELKNKKYL